MPNWATTKLFFKSRDNFNAACIVAINQDGQFDFNRIEPCPNEVTNTIATSLSKQLCAALYAIDIEKNNTVPAIESRICEIINISEPNDKVKDYAQRLYEFFNERISLEDIKAECEAHNERIRRNDFFSPEFDYLTWGQNTIKSLILHDVADWYRWHCEHWQTKWNASHTQIDDDACTITFQTAWCPSMRMVQKLSERIEAPILMLAAEEQISAYADSILFDNGKIVDEFYYDGTSSEADLTEEERLRAFSIVATVLDPKQDSIRFNPNKDESIFLFYPEGLWFENPDEEEAAFDKFENAPIVDISSITRPWVSDQKQNTEAYAIKGSLKLHVSVSSK